VVATGVNADGHREVLGVDVLTGEDGAGWTAFLRDLVARGRSGVELVGSDAHAGLKEAIAAVLPGASWQPVADPRHPQPAVPGAQVGPGLVATLVRSTFAQPDAASTWAQHARIVEQLEDRFPAAAELLAEAAAELGAFTAFPRSTGGKSGPTIRRNG
jgi:transposase-like protein